ncbi:unnamed protein product [Rotaria sp. Silwood1]|nr:unnamed protein product [Rotaria sp. Silwood1]CAF1452821.1 unnamed protein product [Rotaria sp. Silwood1]CAF3621266.1 unnamed protein product [Rotaria sp. Silwood1]CAF3636165.1 unnamed protein product [Rotaria sp. Silwood1]
MSKKRVLIIGVGSAGMSFANQLAEHPEKFDVSLINSIDRCSRQAFSIFVDKEKYGATWFNQGVQGGSPVFHHTFRMFERQGYQVSPVKLQVSFGADEHTLETVEEFEELVLCVLPNQAKILLGKTARWIDKFILGWAKFADDVTVTHSDTEYMENIIQIITILIKLRMTAAYRLGADYPDDLEHDDFARVCFR